MSKDTRTELWDWIRQKEPQWLPSDDRGGIHVFAFAFTVEQRETLLAALNPLAPRPEVASWNTMDTAPIEPFNQELWFKSQKPLLLTNGYGISIGAYSYTERGKGRWMVYGRTYVPTHWMPLPQTPPQSSEDK